jgi:hypothetical protein
MESMKRAVVALAIAVCVGAVVGAPAQRRAHRRSSEGGASAAAARPKQENQFICVEDFKTARRAPRTAVSVEGYLVTCFHQPDGGYRAALVDSVDHVLSARDATAFGRAGASVTIPARFVRSKGRLAWSAKGIQTWVMYTGQGTAQRMLHDVIPKVRLTGWTAGGASISPVTGFEYADESGEWKKL